MGYSQSSYLWFSGRTSNSFFISPIVSNVNKKSDHQKGIVDIYKNWCEYPFEYEPDLTDFDLNKLKIEFRESFPSRMIKQDEIPQTDGEQALYHLYQDKKDAYDKYKQILIKKDEFNKKLKIFIDDLKRNMAILLISNCYKEYEDYIESPLRFYLVIMRHCINKREDYVDGIIKYKYINLSTGQSIENRSWQIPEDRLINLMKERWRKDTEYIKDFQKKIKDLNDLIKDFKYILEPIISCKHLGLKSSCFIEKELSLDNKIKFWKHYKHFESR